MSITLEIHGTTYTAQVGDQTSNPSPITGTPLSTIDVTFQVVGHDNASTVNEHLGTRDEPIEIAGKHYSVGNRSYSHRNDSTVNTFSVTLHEIEELHASSVTLDGTLTFSTIERYNEEIQHEGIVITLVTTTEADATAAFEELLDVEPPNRFFPVLVPGIHDTPLDMRLGRCLYESLDNGTRRHRIVLVQDVVVDGKFIGFNQPETRRLEDGVIALQTLVNSLLDTLVSIEALSSDAAAEIRKAAAQPSTLGQRRQFDRAGDLSIHLDD